MNIAWTYSADSVSLLEFVDETNRRRDLTTHLYRASPKRAPDTACRMTTTELQSIPRLSWINQVATRRQWAHFLENEFDHTHDVVLTENVLGPPTVAAADSYGVPSIFFIRSLLILGLNKYDRRRNPVSNFIQTDIGGKIQFPFLYDTIRTYATALQDADIVVANSEFISDCIKNQFGIDSEIIYPPIKLDQYRVHYNPDGKITMVNPRAKYKGADIFLDIAESLPDREFLVVGSTNDPNINHRIESLENVEYLGWQDDMRQVYRRASVVVVPSQIHEAFGRVAAEAMVSGIPCVVSDRGGLPEVVGDTGLIVQDIGSPSSWIDAILEALTLDSPSHQAERSSRAEIFSMNSQVQHLLDLIDSVTV